MAKKVRHLIKELQKMFDLDDIVLSNNIAVTTGPCEADPSKCMVIELRHGTQPDIVYFKPEGSNQLDATKEG